MININCINEYLKKQKFKKVIFNMKGIINFNITIFRFDFQIIENTLIVKDELDSVLEISFNEVRNVEKNRNYVIVEFNINEKITIKF